MADWFADAEYAEIVRIMCLSDAELVAEYEARGENVREVAERVNRIISDAKAEAYRRQKFGY